MHNNKTVSEFPISICVTQFLVLPYSQQNLGMRAAQLALLSPCVCTFSLWNEVTWILC